MPTTGIRDEDRLIELFLTVYEERSWAGDLSRRELPERVKDGAVELVATQVATGRTLAIEHTIIEPFVGEKSDFHRHFRDFERRVKNDPLLKEPGVALYVDAPVNVLPHRTKWALILDDVCAWLRKEKASFGTEKVVRNCPSAHHPNGTIALQVRRQPLERTQEALVIVQRYGELRVRESVRKALKNKLPKLVAIDVDRRILMLERDQGFVYPEAIYDDVDALRREFGGLAAVHEVWIADTATFGSTKDYVEFLHRVNGKHVESFTFYRGTLESIARFGMPVAMPARSGTTDLPA